jgi:hypothetical protein
MFMGMGVLDYLYSGLLIYHTQNMEYLKKEQAEIST